MNQRRANVEKFTKKLHKCRNQNIFTPIIFSSVFLSDDGSVHEPKHVAQ